MVDLAVAIIIGVAFTAVITAFVEDLITPLIKARHCAACTTVLATA